MNRLTDIMLHKRQEVAALKQRLAEQANHPLHAILQQPFNRAQTSSFQAALRGPKLAVIAEIKRKSPSKGALAMINDPLSLAQQYCASGAQAISVLTDEAYFAGSLADLTQVATGLRQAGLATPLLRKDFLISELQLAEAVMAGASAVLAIVAVLGPQTKTMLMRAAEFGLDVLVEVHNEQELEIALACEAKVIGVNNRNLQTFEIDIEQSLRLIEQIPATVVRVAESGILSPAVARQYHHAGFDAVLIGEALVKAQSPAQFIAECQHD